MKRILPISLLIITFFIITTAQSQKGWRQYARMFKPFHTLGSLSDRIHQLDRRDWLPGYLWFI
jgi:hypothetical protein